MVADQLFAGMYGAIVVDAAPDAALLPVTRERLLVVSDTSLDGAGRVRRTSAMERMRGREGDLLLVNGQVRPVLVASPGERERWRVLNACVARFLRLRVDGQHVQLAGMDSGRFATPSDVEEVVLAPGNRADLLVTTAAGTSQLRALPYDRGEPRRDGDAHHRQHRARCAGHRARRRERWSCAVAGAPGAGSP